jgi:hypothetical protein
MKIAINIIATNKYLYFLEKLLNSIYSNFDDSHDISVIVYTNKEIPESIKNGKTNVRIIKSEIEHENWPYTTLKRFEYFMSESDFLLECDYCYYIDADSTFISRVGDVIFPESGMVGTIHPCLYNGPGTPERNPASKAFIPHGSNNRYYCGGFFGGSALDFVNMSRSIRDNINDDLSRNIIAVWHDESHINKYFYKNPPAVTLEPPFAVAEGLTEIKEDSKVLFLDKNLIGGHEFFRN